MLVFNLRILDYYIIEILSSRVRGCYSFQGRCYIFDNIYCYIVQCRISLTYLSVTLSPPFTPTQYLQYVYLDFNLNVPIIWRCISCLGVLTGNSYSIYVHAGGGGGAESF